MDIYKFHKNPKDLHGHHEANDIVIDRIWSKLRKQKDRATPKQEEIISKNAQYSYRYAFYIIKGPWPKGEEIISKNAHYAYAYARDVIDGPWPKGEESIAKDPHYACYYVLDVLQKPWPKGEKQILSKMPYKTFYLDFLNEGPTRRKIY
jgi:lambda repressor-like predicted transcriptional regulator